VQDHPIQASGSSFDIPDALRDYCENKIVYTIERKHGWVGRMSAPGYMDCTTWSACETEEAMRAELESMYGEDEEEVSDEERSNGPDRT
jgi:G:T-mismatch repair DNA endonuclease (very short patch repair protein)